MILKPDVRRTTSFRSRHDVDPSILVDVSDLDVVVVRPGRADIEFGPERARARVAGRAWVLVPFDAGGIGNDQVGVAILVDVGGLHVRGPATGAPDRVLGPARILIPVHPAAAGRGHHDVELPVAVDVAQCLAVRITWVVGSTMTPVKGIVAWSVTSGPDGHRCPDQAPVRMRERKGPRLRRIRQLSTRAQRPSPRHICESRSEDEERKGASD